MSTPSFEALVDDIKTSISVSGLTVLDLDDIRKIGMRDTPVFMPAIDGYLVRSRIKSDNLNHSGTHTCNFRLKYMLLYSVLKGTRIGWPDYTNTTNMVADILAAFVTYHDVPNIDTIMDIGIELVENSMGAFRYDNDTVFMQASFYIDVEEYL